MQRPSREQPGPGQESCWDYPRPPSLQQNGERLVGELNGKVLFDTSKSWKVRETSHPPTFYIPQEDIDMAALQSSSARSTFCEWKGSAKYFDVPGRQGLAWTYPSPTKPFAAIKDHLAFYAGKLDKCTVDGEVVKPQPDAEQPASSADLGPAFSTAPATATSRAGYQKPSLQTIAGKAFGATDTQVGEVLFNTSLTGYQEILTDPSYKGQFVVFTHPHIGNTGINFDDQESTKCHLEGVVVRDLSCVVSNYRSQMSLDEYLKKENVRGIANVDTRAITRRLRETGCLNGVITSNSSIADAELVERAKAYNIVGKDLISEVTCREPFEWKDATIEEWEFSKKVMEKAGGEPFHVVAYDFGCKTNILRRLASFGCKVTVVPADYPAKKVLEMQPDGVFLSNGPGDPSAVPYAVQNVKELLGQKPMFGICMGHQLLGQAFGGSTFKLKFGHHGGNHPIRHAETGRIEISAQNHNFAVDAATLPAEVEVSHINLNDGTNAGMVYSAQKAMAIQYHPEASPGPHDADVCFEQFIDMLRAERAGGKQAAVAA